MPEIDCIISFQHVDGNMDIIISIPHGGTLNPSWIPNRRHAFQCGKKKHDDCPVVWVSDDFTIDLGFEIAQSIKMYCGREPHLIINHLKVSISYPAKARYPATKIYTLPISRQSAEIPTLHRRIFLTSSRVMDSRDLKLLFS